ncbi:MAG: hypothetical protein NC548_60435, partial [Lachnospiraceae bacterium]|nr:hypothetical protein [Lachnospiraceae bacterium]
MRRKIFAAAMALIVSCGLLTGCGKETKREITLIIKVPELAMNSVSNPDISVSSAFLQMAGEEFAAQYEEADVRIRVDTFAYVDEVKAITDSFDTEEATDLLYEGYFNMASYLHTGRVVPLDDIISDE